MGVMGIMGMMGMMSKRTEGQQHCCWESLRDYSFVKLKLQPSQTELLSRSVADSFLAMRAGGGNGSYGKMGEMGEMGVMGTMGIIGFMGKRIKISSQIPVVVVFPSV